MLVVIGHTPCQTGMIFCTASLSVNRSSESQRVVHVVLCIPFLCLLTRPVQPLPVVLWPCWYSRHVFWYCAGPCTLMCIYWYIGQVLLLCGRLGSGCRYAGITAINDSSSMYQIYSRGKVRIAWCTQCAAASACPSLDPISKHSY